MPRDVRQVVELALRKAQRFISYNDESPGQACGDGVLSDIAAATSGVDLRFHTGDHPIDLACGSEAERTMRFHQLGAWITDRWHGRQFLGVDGDIDATQPMRLHSVVRLMQQRQRLSVNHMNLVQALEQDCRCRTGYALNARGEAWPSDEVR